MVFVSASRMDRWERRYVLRTRELFHDGCHPRRWSAVEDDRLVNPTDSVNDNGPGLRPGPFRVRVHMHAHPNVTRGDGLRTRWRSQETNATRRCIDSKSA